MAEDEFKKKLSSEQYRVLREKGTEAPFSGKLKEGNGTYNCVACGHPLFNSDAKFDSGTGWPSFDQAIPGSVKEIPDDSLGMSRTEIVCSNCGSHLGHVFDDLPAPRPGIYFVYVIRCEDNSMYIGQTQNLLERWKSHCGGTGAEHTKRHQPKHILHYEEYANRDDAVAREKLLKTGFGRKWLQREIKAGRTRQAGGPTDTGKRYCLNSVCLELDEKK